MLSKNIVTIYRSIKITEKRNDLKNCNDFSISKIVNIPSSILNLCLSEFST